jgi:hypothetical protein
METSITAIQKLDSVLSIFDPNSTYRGINNLKIKELLKEKKIDIGERLLTEILHKLVKDNYLRIEVADAMVGTQTFKNISYYLLTFEGELFQTNGGYLEEARARDERRRWEDRLLENGERNGERLNTLTLILAIGTVGLAVIEIIKLCKGA